MPEIPTVPTPGTIKRKLFDDIVKGQTSPDELRIQNGLNGHDLVKNLEQLRKEGFIQVVWGFGDRIRSVKPKPGMAYMAAQNGQSHRTNEQGDQASRLADAINRLPWQSNGWREWDRARVAEETGLDAGQVGKALRVLRDSGRLLQLGGGSRGLVVTGVRWRGEEAPVSPLPPVPEESVPKGPGPRPSPSQALAEIHEKTREHLAAAAPAPTPTPAQTPAGFPESRKFVQRWHALRTARQALDFLEQEEILAQLKDDPAFVLMYQLGPEVERLLLKAEG